MYTFARILAKHQDRPTVRMSYNSANAKVVMQIGNAMNFLELIEQQPPYRLDGPRFVQRHPACAVGYGAPGPPWQAIAQGCAAAGLGCNAYTLTVPQEPI